MTGRGGRRAVRLLASAEAISAIGGVAAYTALTYEVYRRTGSAYWVSAAAFVSFALAGAAAPLAGSLADRYDRRRVMIGSDLAAALIYAGVAVAGTAPLALIVATAAGTVASAPFRPAAMAALPNIADEDDLHRANGLLSSAHAVGIVLGPVLGGAALAAGGASGAFAANALSFVVSALLVARVHGNFAAPGREPGEAVDRMAGFRLCAHQPLLRLLVVIEAMQALGFGVAMAADAPLATSLDAGPGGYAAIITAWGLGSALAGLAMARWPARSVSADLAGLAAGLGLMTLAWIGTAALPSLRPVVAVQFVGGVGMTAVFVLRNAIVQRTIADEVRGRVFAALDAVVSAGALAGLAVSGVIIEQAGVRAPYWAGAVLIAVAAAALVVMRGSRPASRSARAS